MDKIKIVLVTGISGSGKSTVLDCLEDSNYYIVDNIPNGVVGNLISAFIKEKENYPKIGLAIPLNGADATIANLKANKEIELTTIGVTCETKELIERYKLTRRVHPRIQNGLPLTTAIEEEKREYSKIVEELDLNIDTTGSKSSDLKKLIYTNVLNENTKQLSINFISFGYKHGLVKDCDIIFDCRILPNPYWEEDLKKLTGVDQKIIDYVLNNDITKEYLGKFIDMLEIYFDRLFKDGKKIAIVGIACSGGQHRSVVVAEYLKEYFSKKYLTTSFHRDL